MAKANPFAFLQEVRQEAGKVAWPGRRETVITTIMVVTMALIAALFFLAVDSLLGWGISSLLNLSR